MLPVPPKVPMFDPSTPAIHAMARDLIALSMRPVAVRSAPTGVVQPIVAARPKRSFIRSVLPAAIGGQLSFRSSFEMVALRKQAL
jgi:hypothetical protein